MVSCLGSLPAQRLRSRVNRRNLPRRFQSFNRRFCEHYQRTDAEFNALAKSLRSLYEIAQSLARIVSERLGAVRNALRESRIAGPDGVAAASLHDLRDGLAEAASELALLQSIGNELTKLRSCVGSIERVGLSIRSSVFGFAVESARTDQCQQTFGSFIAELRTLGDKITSITEAIDSHASATRFAQEREWKSLSASHAQLCQLAGQLEATANVTATDTQKILDQVLHGLQQAEERMRQITRHAGEAVFYLQFGDIIRQKTEHISEALREIAGKLDPATPRREFSAQAVAADRVIAIQISQLELVHAEVAGAHRELSAAFQSLAEESSQMRGTLGHWHDLSSGTEKDSDSLATFKADLLRMEELHRQGHELRLGARRSTQQAAAASQQLASHVTTVKALNSDIHLQALNAIVKTAALGEQGATLSVLSMHVDSLYCESRSVVNDIVAVLESVLEQTRSNGSGRDLTEEAARHTRLHAGMENIESAFNACRTTFASANELVEQQQAALDDNASLLEFLAQQGAAIQNQIQELTSFREVLAPWMTEQDVAASRLESLNHRYTMQSERDVHENAAKLAASSPVTIENLEFFESPPPNGDAAAPPDQLPQYCKTGRQNEVAASAPVSMGADMGDNVELF